MEINDKKWLSLPWTECTNRNMGYVSVSLGEVPPKNHVRVVFHCPKCKKIKIKYDEKIWSCRVCKFVDDTRKWTYSYIKKNKGVGLIKPRKEKLIKITRNDFKKFAGLWAKGKIDMWDIEVVKRHSGFSELKILEMMKRYSKLDRLYPDVWRKLKKERAAREK